MSCAVLIFFVNIFPNPKKKIHVPGYLLKFIPQLAKLCTSLYNLKALCEQTSGLIVTHVANDHIIDFLSCNSTLPTKHVWGILSLTIFKQALSFPLWLIVRDFLQATKLNCQKYYVFSNANCSSPMKTMQDQISCIRQHLFTDSGSKEKKLF